MSILKKRQITNIESFKMSDVPHFFPTKDSIIAYNNTIPEQPPGESITVIAIDSPPNNIIIIIIIIFIFLCNCTMYVR